MQSQNAFRHIVSAAESIGMKVNTTKTNLMVVSDSLSFNAGAFIEDSDGNLLSSGKAMKILGFHFSYRPNVAAHLEALRKRFRQKYWTLFHLKEFHFNQQ